MWKNGTTKSTQIGFINYNNQKNHGTRAGAGLEHDSITYKLKCLHQDCGHVYGACGSDIFHCKCPRCQGGEPGIMF